MCKTNKSYIFIKRIKKNEMEQLEKYTTSDLYLGAYLKLKGFKMGVEKQRNKQFLFLIKRMNYNKRLITI